MGIPVEGAESAARASNLRRGSVQQQRLRILLAWLVALAAFFGTAECIAFIIYRDAAFGVASITSAGCCLAFVLARRRLSHGRLGRAALIVYAAILGAALVGGIILPTALPMIVLLPLLALALVLPFLWGRTLYGAMLAGWLVMLLVAILAELEPISSSAPRWAGAIFRVGSLAAVAALLLVLLVEFSGWLTDLLAGSQHTNTMLLSTQVQLTDSLHAHQAAAERIARLQAVTAAFSEALTRAQVAQVVLDHGIAALGAFAGAVVLLDSDRGELETIAATYPADTLDPWQRFALAAPVPIAQTIGTGEPIWIETRSVLEQTFPATAQANARIGAWVTLPLTVDAQTIGGLAFSFEHEQSFGADDRAFMLALARQCAQALERARLFEAEQQARQEAQEAVRVRDVLLSIASHELRNPLTSLLGFTDILQRRAQLAEPLTERDLRMLAIVAEQAHRLDDMLTAMLDISRLTTGQIRLERRPVNLVALAEQLIEEFQPTLTTHTIRFEWAGGPFVVAGDELRLRQVLSNLLGNAVKYSPGGIEIAVRLEKHAGMACVAIADQGIGIPRAELPKLFRLFYRASNAAAQPIEGVGIGLAVVKEIITQHGGTVDVASTEGEGSTFTICLPLATNGVLDSSLAPPAG
jgi:signal transduction histidine kinase